MPSPFTLQWTGAIDGATTGTWSTAGNWKDLATGVAALAAPATADNVYIVSTNHAIKAGLGQGAVDLAKLVIGGTFTGQIGSAGTPLTIAVSDVSDTTPAELTYTANATLCNITAGTNGIDKAIINGTGTVTLVGGTWIDVSVGFGGEASITGAVVTGYTGAGGNATADAGTAFTTVDNGAGTLRSSRNLGTCIVGGGLVQALAASASTSVSVTSGARYNVQTTGTQTLIKALAGSTVDAAGALLPVTVTTLKKSASASAFERENIPVNVGAIIPYGYMASL